MDKTLWLVGRLKHVGFIRECLIRDSFLNIVLNLAVTIRCLELKAIVLFYFRAHKCGTKTSYC